MDNKRIEHEDIDTEFKEDQYRCPACKSYNIITRPGMLVDRIVCLDCGYEEYL